MRSFKDFYSLREETDAGQEHKDWRKQYIQLEKGFIPPPKMRPIINAFLDSGDISVLGDTTKEVTMPKKSLFLVGGPVRDFLMGKTIKDYDLATNATPEQVGMILNHAGFKVRGKRGPDGTVTPEFDRSGKAGTMDLPFKPQIAKPGDKMLWYVKGRDASKDNKPFVIGAVVDGEEFDLATFRKDAKVTDGAAEVDFVDNPHEDAARRDLTINSLYIELTKPDGENTKLYDPTGKGWHDAKNKVVRTVGKAEDRFAEDKLRVMRAVRFHCRFGSGAKMDQDIERSIPKFSHLQGVALERIRDEFLKGLLHPDTNLKCYVSIYNRTGLIDKVFPDVQINSDIPQRFSDKRDKPLALAWLLQDNPIEKVEDVLSPKRGGEETPTGWSNEERKAVIYLLKLKEFHPDNIHDAIEGRKGTGLSDDQIRDWVEYFNYTDDKTGQQRARKPLWSKMVKNFADFKADPFRDVIDWHEKIKCPNCQNGIKDGKRCETCGGKGFIKGGVHPEIVRQGMHEVPPTQRSQVVRDLNRKNLRDKFINQLGNGH